MTLGFLTQISISFAREPYTIPDSDPGSYDDIEIVVGNKDSRSGEIFDYLNETQCGGWNMAESAGGAIAVVEKADSSEIFGGDDPNTRFCGDGNADFGENCGEPGLPACTGGETCLNCRCTYTSPPSPPLPPPPPPPPTPECGDGTNDPGEECGEPGLACTSGLSCVNCRCQATCGNGILESDEQCESAKPCAGAGEYCNGSCECVGVCGDGIIGPGEQCEIGIEMIDNCAPYPCQGCQCMNIGDSVSGSFCEVPGLPGREASPFGNIPSGMGVRNDAEEDFLYPYGAEGLSFAIGDNRWCPWFRNKYQEINKTTYCDDVEGCRYVCDSVNEAPWRYPVCRVGTCWAGMYVYAIYAPDPSITWGPYIYNWDIYQSDSKLFTPTGDKVHRLAQCNSCPVLPGAIGGDEQFFKDDAGLDADGTPCPQWTDWISFCWMGQALPEAGEFSGEKFMCTSDAGEYDTPAAWTEPWYDDADPPNQYEFTAYCPSYPPHPEGYPRKLMAYYGWWWDDRSHSQIQIPEQCEQYLIEERTEYQNCTSCGREDYLEVFDMACDPGDPYCENGLVMTPLNNPFEKSDEFAPGQECRCEGEGCRTRERTSPLNDAPYESFTRWYKGKYSRGAVAEVPQDVTEDEACVGCYGWYEEFDTRMHKTGIQDWRCVVDISDGSLISERKPKEMGKGEFGQNASWPDSDPKDGNNQRFGGDPAVRGGFSKTKDLWYKKLGGGFSFLNEEVFKKRHDRDLSTALGAPDVAEMKAGYQLDENTPIAEHTLVRAFDDAVTTAEGDRRPIAEWWQKVETDANLLFSQPIVRLLLPAGWAIGIDPLDPLFVPKIEDENGDGEQRSESIEVQLPAREDIVGEIAAYIERSFLFDLQEEPIPVVVPMGSPTEFRAIAESWCTWWKRKSQTDDCTTAPAEVLSLIGKLEEYAERIESVRNLRGELARHMGKVLEAQYQAILPISQWLEQNLASYQSFFNERKEVFTQLWPYWYMISSVYQEFHDRYNMPWCMNHRFTTPVYSLLDPAWSTRDTNDTVTVEWYCNPGESWPDCLPVLHGISPSKDYVFDFSTLSTPATDAVMIPVIRPIQIKIDTKFLAPPPVHQAPDVPELPDLPDITLIQGLIQTAGASLPGVGVQPPSDIETPPFHHSSSIPELQDEMYQIFSMLWYATCGTGGVSDVTGAGLGICNGESIPEYMWPGIDDFWTSLVRNPDIRCARWSQWPCVHVEMDLIERFVRFGARPAVLLREDFESKGQARSDPAVLGRSPPDICPPDDHTCLLLLPEHTFPSEKWKILIPPLEGQEEDMQQLRSNIRQITLPEPVGGIASSAMFPYDLPLKDEQRDWQELLPAVEVPEDPDLAPYPDLVP